MGMGGLIITLSGGAPWGFRLQGGVEHQKPLQVAKVRKRSKACRAGLREADELVSINEQPCGTLSHAQAMEFIDSSPGILHIRVKRSEKQNNDTVTIDKPSSTHYNGSSRNYILHKSKTQMHMFTLVYWINVGEMEMEEGGLPGVARREVIYQPPGPGMWSSQTSTETSSIISSADDQGPRDGGQEEDSGFLEPTNVPLVSPERAKEAMMLSSRKLNRGDTPQDKHVKEAKTKCRTIASLLTDAPNPHSKGVLMFKKRRQRSKKYTLTSFGSVDEDRCQDSQEEDGVFPGSESEFDEDGFSAVPDPTWDSDYLDMLEKRATAGTEGRGDGAEDAPSPGLSDITGKGAQLFEQQRKRAAEHAKKVEAAQPQAPPQSQVQGQVQMYQLQPEIQPQMQPNLQPQQMIPPGTIAQQELSQDPGPVAAYGMSNGDLSYSAVSTAMLLAVQAPMAPAPAPPVSQILSSPNPVAPVPPLQVPFSQPHPPHFSMAPVATVSVVSQPEAVAPTPVPGPTGRTGILIDARRRSGKPKPMFNLPDVKKNSPNPDLLCMVQNLDERSTRHKYGQPPSEAIYDDAEEERSGETSMGRAPPPVAPKPRVIHEAPQFLQAGGKGAQLFARRQSRMGMYVVDTPPETPYQQEVASHSAAQFLDSTSNPSLASQWKYSPNVRAPPPIGYNPLLGPSIPTGPQRNTGKPESRGRGVSQREGIKALDFMRRQPYQLNSAMFNYGGSTANLSAMPSYQAQRQQHGDYTTATMVGSSLISPSPPYACPGGGLCKASGDLFLLI
uniref:Synaptopodin 2 like n=1 Tax=Sander lucioperca TaxID=283035 RepID=A0A8C9YF96_SANLU